VTEEERPRRDWERSIDQQIREAMERGEFDRLPGAGKPLDLSDNPHTPADWQLAFKVLKDAGFAPEWIEQDKEIRAERDALAKFLDQQVRWQHERLAKSKTLASDQRLAEHERLTAARERAGAVYRERATALNKVIDTFNLKVPSVQLHHARIRIEEELRRFRNACR
jgi:DnaJ family protein C protein 28